MNHETTKLMPGTGRKPTDKHFDFADWWALYPKKFDQLVKLIGKNRQTVLQWRTNRVPVEHIDIVSKFTGVSVEILRHGRVRCIDTGIYGGINIPICGHRAKDLELLRARSRNMPASLDNELMGTPPNGRSVWDQTKAIRGPDGRLLDAVGDGDVTPIDIASIFDPIRNIPKTESQTQHN
ncbi:MAG: hypothetical protein ABJO09_01160 [Hyphomicrobiales bacterium]